MTREPRLTMLERPSIRGLLAFLFYSAISILYFGLPVFGDFTHSMIGNGPDPSPYAWFLTWWPYAIGHGLNPFVPRVIFYPTGVNIAWATSCPGLALLAYPLTALAGATASLNVMSLLSPAASAWSAYLLCRYVCKAFWPALAAGYVFGFSTYVLGQLGGHMSLAMVFAVPLAVYLVLLQLDGLITPRALVVRLTAVLVLQYLISNEVLAVGTLFGAIAVAVAMLVGTAAARRRLWRAGLLIVCSYGAAVVVLSPYLYGSFAYGMSHGPIYLPELYSSDLMGFVVPTPITLGGGGRLARELSSRVVTTPGDFGESPAYLGPFLILAISLFAVSSWRTAIGKLLTITFVTLCIASLGPILQVNGVRHLTMPWAVMTHLPLLDKALPGRFMMFAFLAAAVMLSLFLAQDRHRAARWILGGAALISLMPNLSMNWWLIRYETPAFFAQSLYRDYLSKDETIVILPYGDQCPSMLWQAQSGMYFRMAGGYAGRPPREFRRWPIVTSLMAGEPGFDAEAQLKAFLAAHDVRAIVVLSRVADVWNSLLETLDVEPIVIGDALLYKLRPAQLVAYKNDDVHRSASRWATVAFSNVITAAQNYCVSGRPLSRLTFHEAQRLGIAGIPPSALLDAQEARRLASAGIPGPVVPVDAAHWHDLWLGAWSKNGVAVGIDGEYADLAPLIETYREYASAIYFPYPQLLSGNLQPGAWGQLLMVFKPYPLTGAAAKATTILAQRYAPTPLALPQIAAVDGIRIAKEGGGFAPAELETALRKGGTVTLNGADFDSAHGVALDIFCQCPNGKIGPFLLKPGQKELSVSSATFAIPSAPEVITGGKIALRLSNRGRHASYSAKSNVVAYNLLSTATVARRVDREPSNAGPRIAGINGNRIDQGIGLATPALGAALRKGGSVTLNGAHFDVIHGVAIDVFCVCPNGKLGPFFLDPGQKGLSATSATFTIPASLGIGTLGDTISFRLSNKGSDGSYSAKSNVVALRLSDSPRAMRPAGGDTLAPRAGSISRRPQANIRPQDNA